MAETSRHPALPPESEQPRPTKRRPTKDALLERGAWMPAGYALADATAVQALSKGIANAEQQIRALRWIVEAVAGTYDLSYRPGADEGRRDTDFAEGRRFVGLQIVKMTRADLAKLRKLEPLADPSEPKS